MDLPRSARRRARRLLRRLRPPGAVLVYHRKYATSPSGAPLEGDRAELVLSFLASEGLVARDEVVTPYPASLQDIRRAHDDAYLETLHDPEVLGAILAAPIIPADVDRVLEAHRVMVGGTLIAAERALGGRTTLNLGGGFHHARPDRGHGFCVYNDLVVAVRRLRAQGFAGRVLIVDLDLHDGDGTRVAFAQDPSVHTYSIHNKTWSDAPAVEATVIELGAGFDDARYLSALEGSLPALIARFDPALVLYVAGTDVAVGDRIGDAKVSERGMLERDRRVIDWTVGRSRVVVLGGGYGPSAWRPTARLASLLLGGGALEPPDTERLRLERLRYLARLLPPEALGGDEPLDVDALFGRSAPPTRFLGYYTRHGIELALERYGFIDRLRALGFAQPLIDLELGRVTGDLLRIYSDRTRSELLVELAVRRDGALIAGAQLLFVEWLLLQNPRRRFGAERSPLPGQGRPGLGLLDEVMHLLVLVCERLGLDGIASIPAHYHLARRGRPGMRFLAPEAEAHYLALERAVGALPLGEASRAIAAGRVIDRRSGAPARWAPSPMVLPLRPAAQASPEWQAEVEARLAKLDYGT